MADFTKQLYDLGACPDAIDWVDGRSLRKCWQVADRPDWMLWLVNELDICEREQHELACDFAERVLKYVPDKEDRPRIAIETKRKWLNGEATDKELEDAQAAARAAAAAWAAEATRSAAWAAADDAWAAADAAWTAARAMFAARAAVRDARDAWDAEEKYQCKLIRKRIPVERIEEALAYDDRVSLT